MCHVYLLTGVLKKVPGATKQRLLVVTGAQGDENVQTVANWGFKHDEQLYLFWERVWEASLEAAGH